MTNNGAYVAMDRDATGAREAAATEYNRRLRERAAGILSSEQLAVYEQMFEDAVEQSRSFQSAPSAAIRRAPQE
jgi:hypothetical protein